MPARITLQLWDGRVDRNDYISIKEVASGRDTHSFNKQSLARTTVRSQES